MFKRLLTLYTDKIYSLPVLVLMPHSSCNCRCVMCDIWKANADKRELSLEEIKKHVNDFRKLDVKEIVFSGGEALMHANLWKLCELLRGSGKKLTLLSTGLLLERNAESAVKYLDNVIVSLDGSAEVHDRIRNVPNGYSKIAQGIAAIRKLSPDFRITARCVLQRYNYADFVNTATSAKAIGVDQISFLPADISTAAFNHASLQAERIHEIALTYLEVNELEQIFLNSFKTLEEYYRSKFIAESQTKLMRIVKYYRAILGEGDFPPANCNAPWVSAVVESNGDVMPCFFHKPYGNIYEENFTSILNSEKAITFRKSLDMGSDSACRKCVCSLKLGLTQMN